MAGGGEEPRLQSSNFEVRSWNFEVWLRSLAWKKKRKKKKKRNEKIEKIVGGWRGGEGRENWTLKFGFEVWRGKKQKKEKEKEKTKKENRKDSGWLARGGGGGTSNIEVGLRTSMFDPEDRTLKSQLRLQSSMFEHRTLNFEVGLRGSMFGSREHLSEVGGRARGAVSRATAHIWSEQSTSMVLSLPPLCDTLLSASPPERRCRSTAQVDCGLAREWELRSAQNKVHTKICKNVATYTRKTSFHAIHCVPSSGSQTSLPCGWGFSRLLLRGSSAAIKTTWRNCDVCPLCTIAKQLRSCCFTVALLNCRMSCHGTQEQSGPERPNVGRGVGKAHRPPPHMIQSPAPTVTHKLRDTH